MTNTATLLHLLHLTSPSLPIGTYAYSQGLEYAVQCGWITDETTTIHWLQGLLQHVISHLDVPVFKRLHTAWTMQQNLEVNQWNQFFYACRETAELRAEEIHLGKALAHLLAELQIPQAHHYVHSPLCYITVYALAASYWRIPLSDAATGYVWHWAENQVAAALKSVPLGQKAGQRILWQLMAVIPSVIEQGLVLPEEDIGFSAPGLTLASTLHETQYSRLFRS